MNAPARLSIALRTVVAMVLVVLGGAIPVRLLGAALDPFEPYPGHTADYGVARPRAIRAASPAIAARDEDVVLVFGSSGMARAFVPSVFDASLAADGKRYVSFNLAQLLLQPDTALAMAKTVRATYEARNKRIGITLFGISVPELARDSLKAARQKMPDQAFAFASVPVLEARVESDPLGAVRDGLELAVFGNVRPERMGLWLDEWITARPVGCDSGMKQPADSEEGEAELPEILFRAAHGVSARRPAVESEDQRRPGFRTPAHAAGPCAARRAAETTTAARGTARSVAELPNDIDDHAVEQLIAALRELEAVSNDTFVLRDVLNPALLAPLPPAQVMQWRTIAERIARDGDVRLLDLNDGTVSAADFGDRTHLNPLAAERFTSALAARVRPIVRQRHASR